MNSGEIKISPTYNNLSLSRNSKLWYGVDRIGGGQIQFVIDQDALRNHYKVKPHTYFGGSTKNRLQYGEFEEIVSENIPVNSKYISKILIAKEIVNAIHNPNLSKHVRSTAKMRLTSIIDKAKECGIDVEYVDKN